MNKSAECPTLAANLDTHFSESKFAAGFLAVDLLERRDELLEIVGCEVRVLTGAALALERHKCALEPLRIDPVDHLAEHLDQPAVRVVGEPRVAGARREPGRGLVVQPEVEDRVHHPRHRHRGARPHGDEQRVVARAEALAGRLLEPAHVLVHFLGQPVGQLAGGHERATRVGGDREARRHRDAHQRHLGEPDPLAAEQFASAGGVLVEVVDERGHLAAEPTDGAHGTRRPRQRRGGRTRTA